MIDTKQPTNHSTANRQHQFKTEIRERTWRKKKSNCKHKRHRFSCCWLLFIVVYWCFSCYLPLPQLMIMMGYYFSTTSCCISLQQEKKKTIFSCKVSVNIETNNDVDDHHQQHNDEEEEKIIKWKSRKKTNNIEVV